MSIETPAGNVVTNSKIDAQMYHHMHIISPHESWLHTFKTNIKPTNLHLAPMQLEIKVFTWLHWFSILERSHLALPPASRATQSHLLTVWSWTFYKPTEERHSIIMIPSATNMFYNFYDLKSKCRNSRIKKPWLGFKKKNYTTAACFYFILQITADKLSHRVQVTPLDILKYTWRYFWLCLWQVV